MNFLDQSGREIDVVGRPRLLVVKMRVRTKIWAVPRWASLEIYGANEVTLHECFETVIDGGERDSGHLVANTGVNLISRGVVALFQENVEDDLALWGGAQSAVGELSREHVGCRRCVGRNHGEGDNKLEWF